MGPRVAIRTLGCKLNRAESEQIVSRLLGSGFEAVAEDEADVVVVNTCTVTGEADAKARKAIRQALKASSAPLVVVTGCLAALDDGALSALSARVIVEPDKAAVPSRVRAALGLPEAVAEGVVVRTGEGFRTRVALKVQDGCDNFCAYCIVPFARGVPTSIPLSNIAREAVLLVESGVPEIVLTGVNLGRYRDDGRDLADVVRTVTQAGVSRLRLSSIEPPDLTPRLLEALSQSPAVCAHLHVPLQSGSNPVLQAMGRKYSTSEYADAIARARDALPGLTVTTDIIAGYPGETDADHARTLEFAQEIVFSKLHVFRYSQREGTPAAALPQVSPEVRAQRAGELRELGSRLRSDYVASRLGSRAEVLIERVNSHHAEGTTRDYLRVRTSPQGLRPGDIVSICLEPDALATATSEATA